jgi:hypothetical protein
MRTSLKLIAASGLLVAMGLVGPVAVAGDGKAGVTFGQLAVRLATIIEIDLPASKPERSAAAALRRIGVSIDRNLNRMMTEGDLLLIGASLGIEVSSSDPTAPVSVVQSASFSQAVEVSLWGAQAEASAESGDKEDDINASCQGRASRAGRRGTPASPASPNATAGPCTGSGEPQP